MVAPYYVFSGISCTTGVITGLWFSSLYPPVESLINQVYSGIYTSDIYTVINEPVQNLTRPTSVFVVPSTINSCPTFKISCVGDCTYVKNVGYVNLGNQTWYAKNVDVEIYTNNVEIIEIQDPGDWSRATYPAWCYYNNDPVMGAIYGKLYNWYAVKSAVEWGILDKDGNYIWIPSSNDWHVLSTFLGGDLISANSLKESGTSHWNIPNSGATNGSCFTALPVGYRLPNGTFSGIGVQGNWWTYTQGLIKNSQGSVIGGGAYNISLKNDSSQLYENVSVYNYGFSLRGMKVDNYYGAF